MVNRVYVEKKEEIAFDASSLLSDLRALLRIYSVTAVRVINRYDAEINCEEPFEYFVKTVFSEPQLDIVSYELDDNDAKVFATEYLPGQFDQRADSAAQCIQIISRGERPVVKTAKVYLVYGDVSDAELEAIKKYVINPVDSREAALNLPKTLEMQYPLPQKVATLEGFRSLEGEAILSFISEYGLAMDEDDLAFCRDYFISEKRDPTITEVRLIDTYWSDHCRHTTFNTIIDSIDTDDEILKAALDKYIRTRDYVSRKKPITLMDLGTIAVKRLKADGLLSKLDESEEINACTVKIDVTIGGVKEPWLLLFKNETHNHPTEIEPFGGAATCIGGAIRDPLSGRSYVYAAMRLTGAANPLLPVSETIPGKLPQRKIVTTAAAGYSSYGNQIGLATGIVDELYHDGYAAKRMEVGAVIAATPEKNVRRQRPENGDLVILLGGATGRDGCGGATGSSKSHDEKSIEECGAQIQKGNAPEERKIQRLFRNEEASLLIKKCNDFGAGGVSVAVGELAGSLDINLDSVPKKYDGLDGTELAISESQERMAVVVNAKDADRFLALADEENIAASIVATVTDSGRLRMSWNGDTIVDISREFLDTNGAEKHITVSCEAPKPYTKTFEGTFEEEYFALAGDLNICSKRGLSERFDSTIGAGSVLMPFGGKNQLTPVQAMVNKISIPDRDTSTCSLMSWGFNPYISEKSPYHGAYLAVIESVSKLIATGAKFDETYLSFQEYFERLGKDPKRWGKPASALLGALTAQLGLGVAAIGGKDSMSGSFEKLDVPPTLISFAVTTGEIKDIISPEFKKAGHKVVWLKPEYDETGLPNCDSLKKVFGTVSLLMRTGKVCAAYTPCFGGVAEAVLKMCLGNSIGFKYEDETALHEIFGYSYGSFILELSGDDEIGALLGCTTGEEEIALGNDIISLAALREEYEDKLESVFACNIKTSDEPIPAFSYKKKRPAVHTVKIARPRVLIPVFPGTNCEYDSAKQVETAGAAAEIFIVKNLSADAISRSIDSFAAKLKDTQIIFIPGGFSGGDEPDGSGKFITAFFRNAAIKDEVSALLDDRGGLICGICNGFQALIKLGLVPYGKILDPDENSPTLTFNSIGRHQSKIVRTRIASTLSPWLSNSRVGDVYSVPISHGEGRFYASDELIEALAKNGQIATQYVDFDSNPTSDIAFNPNNSVCAIEGITSPDGRVFGKMGHSERIGSGLYRNVPGKYDIGMFKNAVNYFK